MMGLKRLYRRTRYIPAMVAAATGQTVNSPCEPLAALSSPPLSASPTWLSSPPSPDAPFVTSPVSRVEGWVVLDAREPLLETVAV